MPTGAAHGGRARRVDAPLVRPRLHLIANAHIDPVWIWDWREGMREVAHTFRAVLDVLDEYPDLVFTASSAAFYRWLDTCTPDDADRIRAAMGRGAWVAAGGEWVEPDCNIPNGEAVCRQLLYGQRYLAEHFGHPARTAYNVDSFGHAASLPQLFVKSGLAAYVMMRPEAHEKELPARLFDWVGIDGTTLPTYRIPFGYAVGNKEEIVERATTLLSDDQPAMLFFGVGNHGGGPTRAAMGAAAAVMAEHGDAVVFSSPDQFFDAVADLARPTVTGELQWHAVGCYSTLLDVKRANALCEEGLMTAEMLASLSHAATGRDLGMQSRIAEGWRSLLFTQAHDSLGGTCTRRAYDDLGRFTAQSLATADVVATVAAQTFADEIDTRDCSGRPLIVYNPLSWPLTTLVAVNQPARGVTDAEGRSVPVQSVPSGDVTRSATVALFQAVVPALGYAVYELHDEAREIATREPLVQCTVDPSTGAVTSLVDGPTGRPWIEPEGIHPIVIDDPSDTWSHGVARYDGAEQAATLEDVAELETGPVRWTTRVVFRVADSLIAEDVSCYAGRRFLELRFTVDWRARATVLKVVVPLRIDDPTTTAGAPYGQIGRPASGHEEVMGRWVDLRDGRGGMACTADCTYGYDVLGGRLRLTALRSPRYADHGQGWATDVRSYPVTDQGLHTFSYRLHPHTGANGHRLAGEHRLLAPVLVDNAHAGHLPRRGRYVDIDAPNVDVSVIKRAEAGRGWIVRVWETCGRPATVRIHLRTCDREWAGAMAAHEVKTFYCPDDATRPMVEVDIPELGVG